MFKTWMLIKSLKKLKEKKKKERKTHFYKCLDFIWHDMTLAPEGDSHVSTSCLATITKQQNLKNTNNCRVSHQYSLCVAARVGACVETEKTKNNATSCLV